MCCCLLFNEKSYCIDVISTGSYPILFTAKKVIQDWLREMETWKPVK